jgi:hypothetical protein
MRSALCLAGALLLLAAGGAQAQSAGSVIAGPFSATLPSTQSFSFARSFGVPAGAVGSYVLRVQLSAPNNLTTLAVSLNGARVLALADFANGVTSVDARRVTAFLVGSRRQNLRYRVGTIRAESEDC